MGQMKPNSLAVFNSNDIYPVSADSTLPFEQHRDIFYLSGADQEESVLVLFPDCPKENLREVLFLKETNEHIEDLEKVIAELMSYSDTVYINTNEHYRATVETETREDRFTKWLLAKYPAHSVAKYYRKRILQNFKFCKT